MPLNFTSKVFKKEKVILADTTEYLVPGGRSKFELLEKGFEGIKQIGVIGWGSQGPAQAMNLRDSLEHTNIKVVLGLRKNSTSWKKAEKAKFTTESGTLGEMFSVIKKSDLIVLLISDAAQATLYKEIFKAIKPNATLGLSHGFLQVYLQTLGEEFPKNINVIGVCPKGMGPSVRRLYEQGKKIDGAGINTSFAVHQDVTGKATDYAISWAVALGAPFSFCTTLNKECLSDIYGERGILLGAVHGIVESLYRYFVDKGMEKDTAFINTVESITGPISQKISHEGILAVYKSMSAQDKKEFEKAYNASYFIAKEVLQEIYDEVSSGNEVRSVVYAMKRMETYPMGIIDNTEMWTKIGKEVRANRQEEAIPIHPITAGIYIATMMAQVDILYENKHSYSEIVNESIIEAVDSLNPYMHFKGVSYMVDNCSTTARLGSRKWAPRFDYMLCQNTYVELDGTKAKNSKPITAFKNHSVHQAVDTLLKYRPSIDIAVK